MPTTTPLPSSDRSCKSIEMEQLLTSTFVAPTRHFNTVTFAPTNHVFLAFTTQLWFFKPIQTYISNTFRGWAFVCCQSKRLTRDTSQYRVSNVTCLDSVAPVRTSNKTVFLFSRILSGQPGDQLYSDISPYKLSKVVPRYDQTFLQTFGLMRNSTRHPTCDQMWWCVQYLQQLKFVHLHFFASDFLNCAQVAWQSFAKYGHTGRSILACWPNKKCIA